MRHRRTSVRTRAVLLGLLVQAAAVGLGTVLLAGPASAAPPTYTGTLAGPSPAAMYPSGAEVDLVNDRLVVADTGRDRILFYSLNGNKQSGFGSYGTGEGEFASPRDVAVDEAGNLYVADAENNRIQAFDSEGAFKWQAGGIGTGNANLNTPIGVTWDTQNDVLLVASTGQSLIKAWDAAGAFQWKSPSGNALGAHAMRDVSRGPDGRLWVTAYKEHQIKVYDVSPAGVWGSIDPVFVLGDGATGGHDEGQLNFPYNVVFSDDGDTVYVSDTGNGRIARWDISGTTPQWLEPFGGRCPGHPKVCDDPPGDAGLYNHLRRVAIDADGNLYGADFWGGGFWVFDPDGTVLHAIEGAEAPVPGFAEAYGVDVAPDGQVYVMDRLNHRIERFRADGTFVDHVGSRGTQLGTFSWPEAVTVGPDGSVWAVDTRGDRIERFDADLSTVGVTAHGGTGSAVGKFTYPEGADVDATGVVWVADTRNHRLQKYDPVGNTFSTIGAEGTGPGQFTQPMGVAVTADAVYVADTGNNRVQKLDLDGTHLASFASGLSAPEGIEVAPDGTVWVADTQNSRLVHLSADLADLGDGFGSRGDGDNQFFNPHDLAFGNDQMYVADTFNDRVQVFALDGTTEPPPTPLEPTYRAEISDPGGIAPIYPAGVAVIDGTWYVADSGGSRVVTVNPATGAVDPVATSGLTDPRDLEQDAADPAALWVTDTGGNRIVRISRTDGEQLATLTGLTQPYGLANDEDRVYAANTYDNSVKAYNRDGSTAWTQTTCGGEAFSRPRDVGLADDGHVVVADTDNDRLAVLDPADGSCVRTFGNRGTAAGQFKAPRSVSADGDGGLWVADALNYRVQHVTMTGGSLGATPVDAYGDGPQQFRSPHCVTPLPGSTEVAVCDPFNFRVAVYGGAGATPAYDRTVGGARPAEGGFNGAFAVAYGPDGSLYAADWFNHRIQKFDADGDFVTQWGGYGPKNGSLIFPRGLVVTDAGDVVVTDSENNRIDVFTADGEFVKQVKPAGTALSRPHQTALDGSGGYWVADTNNNRVLHLDPAGDVLASFPITGSAATSKPEGIAVDVDGSVLVSNTRNNRVERYSASGDLLGTVAGNGTGTGQVRTPGGLLVTGTGQSRRLWISDAGNDRVTVLDAEDAVEASFGESGTGDGELDQPRGVAVDPTDQDIAVADYANNRVSLWNSDSTAPPTPTDMAPPQTAVWSPAAGAVLSVSPVTVTGTASDDVGLDSVGVLVKDLDTGLWVADDGTSSSNWADTRRFADLATPGGMSTTWGVDIPLAEGRYSIQARARDTAGKNDATAAVRKITVQPTDSVAPEGTMTSPANGASVPLGPVETRGTATDDVGVATVLLAVRDKTAKKWLRTDGTWSTSYATVVTTLASPDEPDTEWTYTFEPPGPGGYGVSVVTRDAAGNQDPTKPWIAFNVSP